MNVADRLILWDPNDPEFPTDAWEVGQAVYWAAVAPNRDDHAQYLLDLLASPDLANVQGLLGGIARRHGVEDDDAGRLMALHSVLVAGEEMRSKCRAITERLKAYETAGDVRGQTEALRALARLEPRWFDYWDALANHVEKTGSAAGALAEMRAGEPFMRDHLQFRLELLRLICACGKREEALTEGKAISEQLGVFAEVMIQAHEEYRLAWPDDPDAEKRRVTEPSSRA